MQLFKLLKERLLKQVEMNQLEELEKPSKQHFHSRNESYSGLNQNNSLSPDCRQTSSNKK
jgi:hypothetical protein